MLKYWSEDASAPPRRSSLIVIGYLAVFPRSIGKELLFVVAIV